MVIQTAVSKDLQTLLIHAFVYLTKGYCCGLTPASNQLPQLSPKNIFTLFLELFQIIAILFLFCFYYKVLVLLAHSKLIHMVIGSIWYRSMMIGVYGRGYFRFYIFFFFLFQRGVWFQNCCLYAWFCQLVLL